MEQFRTCLAKTTYFDLRSRDNERRLDYPPSRSNYDLIMATLLPCPSLPPVLVCSRSPLSSNLKVPIFSAGFVCLYLSVKPVFHLANTVNFRVLI